MNATADPSPELVETAAPAVLSPQGMELARLHRTILVMKGCEGLSADEIEQYQNAADMMPQEGEDFLGFRLVRELGRGSFGRVFLATQYELANRKVALKIAPDVGSESERLARLQHTHIVPIHSVYLKGSLQALCMPYLGSNTLADLIGELRRKRSGDTDPKPLYDRYFTARNRGEIDGILAIVAALAEGLEHAHERNVLHCDLKPANVLLSDDGEPMLLDFNLSLNTLQATAVAIGGTLPYMPPEQLQRYFSEGPGLDRRSDLYSLGVILFELLTGVDLFATPVLNSPAQQVHRMLEDRWRSPPNMRAWNRAVTPALQSIVTKLLAYHPAERYATAAQLAEDLRRQMARLPLQYAPDRSWRERWSKFRSRNRRLTSGLTLSVTAFTVLIGITAGLMTREQQVARREATAALRTLQDERREVAYLLTGMNATPQAKQGITAAESARERFQPHANHLTETQQAEARGIEAELLFLQALGHGLEAKQVALGRTEHIEQADHLLRKVEQLQFDSGLARATLVLQAELARLRGDESEAVRLTRLAAATDPISARDFYLSAVAAYEQSDYATAVHYLERFLSQEPSGSHGWSLLGVCRERQGKTERAIAAFSTVIALRPHDDRAYYLRGTNYLALRSYTLAEHDLSAAIRLNPDRAEIFLDRSLARSQNRQWAAAEADLTRALELRSEWGRAYLLRSRVRHELGDREGAAHDRMRGLEQEPKTPVEWVTRGLAQATTNPAAALADYDAALRIDPTYLAGLQNKAALLVKRLHRPDEALKILDEAVRNWPDDARARAGRGILLARQGKREAAIQDALVAAEHDRSAKNLHQVAGIYALTSRLAPDDVHDAIALLTAALRNGLDVRELAIDPDLEPIRNHPRYVRLIRDGVPEPKIDQ